MHTCPHPLCSKKVSPDHLACPAHWFELPVPIRNEIWETFHQAPGSPEHTAAIGKAVAFWNAQIHWR